MLHGDAGMRHEGMSMNIQPMMANDDFINNKMSGYPFRTAYRRSKGAILLNIGAGSFKRSGWTNLDFENPHYGWDKDSFIQYDITEMKPLPFESGSVKAVYISHVVEHLKDQHVRALFSEIRRVLKRRGVFRLAVPNADIYYMCMRTGETASLMWRNRFFRKHGWEDMSLLRPAHYLVREVCTARGEFLSLPSEFRRFESNADNPKYIPVEIVEKKFASLKRDKFFEFLCRDLQFDPSHAGDHINWWNFDKVKRFLEKARFGFVMPSSCLASSFAPMKEWPHFDSTRPMMSLYVEATP